MDLAKIRKEIDATDDQILSLFLKRMELCVGVAKYKKENNMQVFQGKREQEILERIMSESPDDLAEGAGQLFTCIMDISKCLQQRILSDAPVPHFESPKTQPVRIACPGTKGSNTEEASVKLFPDSEIDFYPDFSDVFEAVENGSADYGVLPIENSTAGDIRQTYDLLAKYNFYICKRTQIKINHCLAAKPGADIKTIYSHEQALKQCFGFLKEYPARQVPYANTALAAEMVANSDDNTIAAICSERCAELYGLETVKRDIADNPDNTTRFICISKRPEVTPDADIISICMSLPHTTGSLYRMLIRFALYGLNITKIESAPVPQAKQDIKRETFDVVFYLDFEGNALDPEVVRLMTILEEEMKYFKFLGNYKHFD